MQFAAVSGVLDAVMVTDQLPAWGPVKVRLPDVCDVPAATVSDAGESDPVPPGLGVRLMTVLATAVVEFRY